MNLNENEKSLIHICLLLGHYRIITIGIITNAVSHEFQNISNPNDIGHMNSKDNMQQFSVSVKKIFNYRQ